MRQTQTYFEIEASSVTTKIEGGILKFLIIYRKKLGDFTFPKGHLENNESLEEAARRETFEETGYKIKITGEIAAFEYRVKEERNGKEVCIIRRVYNFLGEVTGGQASGKNFDLDEGDMEVMWMSYEEALSKLSYQNNKDLIRKTKDLLKN